MKQKNNKNFNRDNIFKYIYLYVNLNHHTVSICASEFVTEFRNSGMSFRMHVKFFLIFMLTLTSHALLL